MGQHRVDRQVLSLLLLLCVVAAKARGDSCYSARTGYINCWNGCCGQANDQRCCSSLALILGLGLGGGIFVLAVFTLICCLICKDCQPKTCFDRARGRADRTGRRMRRSAHFRRVTVQPVAPPDYDTATQQRAPSVQPGMNFRNIPQSPPPPYVETVPSPPTEAPSSEASSQSPRDHDHPTDRSEQPNVSTAAGTVSVSSRGQGSVHRAVSPNSVPQSSDSITSESAATNRQGEPGNINTVLVTSASGSATARDYSATRTLSTSGRVRSSDMSQNSSNHSSIVTTASDNTPVINTQPLTASVSGSRSRAKEPTTIDTTVTSSQEATQTNSLQNPNTSSQSGRTVLHRLGESAEEENNLCLI